MIKSSFIFCYFTTWIAGLIKIAADNGYAVSIASILLTAGLSFQQFMITESLFGTTYFVLLLVLGTVLINTGYGIKKNVMKSRIFFAHAQQHEHNTRKHKHYIKKWEAHKYDYRRLFFVFFKFTSFMGYLLIAKALMSEGTIGEEGGVVIQALEFSTEVLIRVPIAIFWYYEFKSIGENTEYIYGQKASIYKIVEFIFEPRILKFLGTKTPSDGNNDYTPPKL